MESIEKGIRTVSELTERLKQYQSELTITIFDTILGDAPVAFKSEKAVKGESVFKWITLFPSDEAKKTTVGNVLSILEKCPPQMLITMRGENGKYSDLFTSIESMVGDISGNKWVVISDKLSYEKYFQTKEPTTKELALEKTAKEIGENATSTEKLIQGWLINQTDEKLHAGVLKTDRTINGSIQFATTKAKNMAQGKSTAMVDSDTVFEWIREYFTSDKIEMPKVKGKVSTGKTGKKDNSKKSEPKEAEGQFSLF